MQVGVQAAGWVDGREGRAPDDCLMTRIHGLGTWNVRRWGSGRSSKEAEGVGQGKVEGDGKRADPLRNDPAS